MFGRLCLIIFVYRWLLSYFWLFGLCLVLFACLRLVYFCSYWFLVGLFPIPESHPVMKGIGILRGTRFEFQTTNLPLVDHNCSLLASLSTRQKPNIDTKNGNHLFQTIASPVGLCHDACPYFFGGIRISHRKLKRNQTE